MTRNASPRFFCSTGIQIGYHHPMPLSAGNLTDGQREMIAIAQAALSEDELFILANKAIELHGGDAHVNASALSEKLLNEGDVTRAAVWFTVSLIVRESLNRTPPKH
jgi:ABC-type transport system involved in cytochrome c biogenesis ATPase subunit